MAISTIGTNGLDTGSVTQPKVATGTAGTGPAFSVYHSGGQSVPSAVITKIQFNTKTFDTNNNFDATTNYRFTPTIAGYYQINLTLAAASATGVIQATIYKNGSQYLANANPNINTGGQSTVSAIIYCNGTTDYIEGYMYQNSGSSYTLASNRPDIYQFSGAMVRGA